MLFSLFECSFLSIPTCQNFTLSLCHRLHYTLPIHPISQKYPSIVHRLLCLNHKTFGVLPSVLDGSVLESLLLPRPSDLYTV